MRGDFLMKVQLRLKEVAASQRINYLGCSEKIRVDYGFSKKILV